MLLGQGFFDDLLHAWLRHQDTFWPNLLLFVSLTLRGLGLALLLGIPVAIILSRLPRIATPVIGVLAVLQTVPSLVLLGLLLPLLGIGQTPALFAAVIYSLFPIVLNTCVGIKQVSASIRDAARGMGMTGRQVLWHVELPLSFPVILAGVRTGAIYAGAMIVIGTFIGAGGLGDYIANGLNRNDNGLIWLGAIPVLLVTVLLFWGLGGLAWLSTKNSSLGMSLGGGLIVLLSVYAVWGFAARALQPRRDDVQAEAQPIVIGGKNFTEGQILTEIMKQTIERHANLTVEVKSNLGTSMILNAIKTGDIDMYAEYTGNLLTSKEALDMPVPADKSRITEIVRTEMRRRFDLILLDVFGLNNTYAPSVTKATAKKYRLKKISDLQRTPQLRTVIDQSFLTRPDGWEGLVKKYSLRFDTPPRQMSPDLLYRALEQSAADVVIGFATDWQIQSLNLVVLEDDRGYFPSYHAAPLVRAATLERHPEIATALKRLAGRIDDAAMRRLNYEVAVRKRSEADVAREFLAGDGSEGSVTPAQRLEQGRPKQ
jgi:osmoprotectant transport system permease protein